jgi:serine/threonine protein kinase
LLARADLAEVHRGHDRVLDRPVSLNLIRRLPRGNRARTQLTTEVNAWASLQHPSLQALWDADLAARRPFIVTELVEGTTLPGLLEAGSLTADHIARIALEIAGALNAVHDAGLVHGDLTGAAIFVRRDGTAKLTGFALARLAAHVGTDGAEGAAADDLRALGAVLQEADATMGGTDSLGPRWRDLLVALGAEDPSHLPTARETAAVLRSIVPSEERTVVLMPRAPGAHLARRHGWRVGRYLAAGAAAAVLFVAVDGWLLLAGNSDPGNRVAEATVVAAAPPVPTGSLPAPGAATHQAAQPTDGVTTPTTATTAATSSAGTPTTSAKTSRSMLRKALTLIKGHKGSGSGKQ